MNSIIVHERGLSRRAVGGSGKTGLPPFLGPVSMIMMTLSPRPARPLMRPERKAIREIMVGIRHGERQTGQSGDMGTRRQGDKEKRLNQESDE
jgi:hypothetical protein